MVELLVAMSEKSWSVSYPVLSLHGAARGTLNSAFTFGVKRWKGVQAGSVA